MPCEKDRWTQTWEYNMDHYACLNMDCCSQLSADFLGDYYTSIYLNYLNASMVLLFVGMLYYVRVSEHGDFVSKTTRLVVSILLLMALVMCLLLNSPKLPIYRTMLVEQAQYFPADNMKLFQPQHHPYKYRTIQN